MSSFFEIDTFGYLNKIPNYYKDIEEVLDYMNKLGTYKPKNIHSQKVSSLVKEVRFLIKNGYPN